MNLFGCSYEQLVERTPKNCPYCGGSLRFDFDEERDEVSWLCEACDGVVSMSLKERFESEAELPSEASQGVTDLPPLDIIITDPPYGITDRRFYHLARRSRSSVLSCVDEIAARMAISPQSSLGAQNLVWRHFDRTAMARGSPPFSYRDPRGLAAAALHVACQDRGERASIRDLAEHSAVAGVVIRHRVKEIRDAMAGPRPPAEIRDLGIKENLKEFFMELYVLGKRGQLECYGGDTDTSWFSTGEIRSLLEMNGLSLSMLFWDAGHFAVRAALKLDISPEAMGEALEILDALEKVGMPPSRMPVPSRTLALAAVYIACQRTGYPVTAADLSSCAPSGAEIELKIEEISRIFPSENRGRPEERDEIGEIIDRLGE